MVVMCHDWEGNVGVASYWPTSDSVVPGAVEYDLLHFLSGRRIRGTTKHGFSFLRVYFVLQMNVCFCRVLGLLCSVLRREIGWEERLRNDLFCVEWDAKTSITSSLFHSCLKTYLFHKSFPP